MNDHGFIGRTTIERIEVTELGMKERQFLEIPQGVLPGCNCGWIGDEVSDMDVAKFIWGNGHMGWSLAETERWSNPMTDADKEASRKRKQEIVDRFIWV